MLFDLNSKSFDFFSGNLIQIFKTKISFLYKMKVIGNNIWNKFKKIEILSSNKYSSYYKVKNINTGNYFGIKEINKQKFKKLYNYDI